ncbi:hypothetical protein K1J60_00375 [Streptomyces akebiae]|uniref:Uncharacterized protein n=1 Tax=Streptomyces akebiae TaxID=2865673 RepID=A0ABX8XHF3_9ACTN|nr:hypothetical protein K1J60_00375 [Streptomyces akebiae]
MCRLIGSSSSAQLLSESDDEALRATDVAEEIAVLELGDFAHEFSAAGCAARR